MPESSFFSTPFRPPRSSISHSTSICIYIIFLFCFIFIFFYSWGYSLFRLFSFAARKSPAGAFPRQKPLALITRGNSPKNSRPSRCYYIYTSYCSALHATACANGVAPRDFYYYILYRSPEFNIILWKNSACVCERERTMNTEYTNNESLTNLEVDFMTITYSVLHITICGLNLYCSRAVLINCCI